MKVGEETFTAGDTGPWGTIMAVQHTLKNVLDTVPKFQVGKFAGANVRGGIDGFLTVAVVLGPKKEITLTRVPFRTKDPSPWSKVHNTNTH
jgi:hypothetical protein